MKNYTHYSLLLLWMSVFPITKGIASSSYLGQCEAEFTFTYIDDQTLIFINTSDDYLSQTWIIEGDTLPINESDVMWYTASSSSAAFEACLVISTADNCTDTLCLEVSRDSPNAFCVQNDCVWPGDTNGDWKANNFDLLNLGLGFGQTGPAREDPPIEENPMAWAPNIASDWDHWINDYLNYKHLDCNGDGVVNRDDIQAIFDNYNPDFDYNPTPGEEAPPVYFHFSAEVVEWDYSTAEDIVLKAKLMIGNEEFPVEDLHGIALDFSYPRELMEGGTISIDQPHSSLLGYSNYLLKVEYDHYDSNRGRYDVALSRQSTNGVNGFGSIFEANFIVSGDIIGGLNEPITPFEIAVERVRMINHEGDSISYSLGDLASITIINSQLADIPTPEKQAKVNLFPNPVNQSFSLQSPGYIMQTLEIYDSQGRRLEQRTIGSNRMKVDVKRFKPGLYWVRVQIGEEWVLKKMIVQD